MRLVTYGIKIILLKKHADKNITKKIIKFMLSLTIATPYTVVIQKTIQRFFNSSENVKKENNRNLN